MVLLSSHLSAFMVMIGVVGDPLLSVFGGIVYLLSVFGGIVHGGVQVSCIYGIVQAGSSLIFVLALAFWLVARLVTFWLVARLVTPSVV